MLLGYGDEVSQVMVDTELYYYVEQDTQQAPEEVQEAAGEVQEVAGISDDELSILF